MKDVSKLLEPLRRLHETIRAAVVEACERAASGELATVVSEEEGDTIFALDRVSEEVLIDFFEREVAPHAPVLLIAEGLSDGQIIVAARHRRVGCCLAHYRGSDRWHARFDVSKTQRLDTHWCRSESWSRDELERH